MNRFSNVPMPLVKNAIRATVLVLSLLSGMVYSVNLYADGESKQGADANEEELLKLPLEELRMFADVFNQIRLSYVEEVDDRTLLTNAIKGMLNGLDPHSQYLDAESFDDLQTNTTGEFGGLGLEVGMENGFVVVIAPMDDTPAQKAGIESGDLIIQLDNKPVKGMSLQEAVSLMRGKVGTEINLLMVREGLAAPFEVKLTRDTITVASVRHRELAPGYGYIRLAQFQVNSGEQVAKALKDLHKKAEPGKLKGLVLDLRNNPGGVLGASIDVADLFLEEGLVVYTEGRMPSSYNRFEASSETPADKTRMVVLINSGSASASEIVAGALQDQKRAVIMGTKTFGKGSVQTVLPLAKERAIKMTTARYFTPSGRSIQAQGIDPDIVVERAKIETIKPGMGLITEADLVGHLSNEKGESDSVKRKNNKTESLASRDSQLYEALNLLKGLSIISERDAQ